MTDDSKIVITYDHDEGLIHKFNPETGITTHEFTKEKVAAYWAAKKISFAIRYENSPEFRDKVDRGRYLQLYQRLKYEYDQEFKAKKIATALQFNKDNKEKHAEACKKYKEKNNDKLAEYRRNYYQTVIKPKKLAEKQAKLNQQTQQAQQV